MSTHDPSHQSLTKGFSRRGVMRTAAWSVPAISVATAAPAFATTPGESQVSGLQVFPIRSWTATEQDATQSPFPGEGLLLGAYMAYFPIDANARAVIQPTVTVRVPMWTGAEDLALNGLWLRGEFGSDIAWQVDRPGPVTTTPPGPLLSSDGEFAFSAPGGMPVGSLTAVLVQVDVGDHLPFQSPASASVRVTPPGMADFVSGAVTNFGEFESAALAWLGSVMSPGRAARSRASLGFPGLGG